MTFGLYLGNNKDMLQIQEPIDVWVLFSKNKIQPSYFFWRGRQIKVEKINLVHTSKDGGNTFYHFSISSGGNFYRLRFDLAHLKWFLEAIDEDYTPY